MGRMLRNGMGLVLTFTALGALFYGISQLREHDYLASGLLLATGLAILRGGVELLRPAVGE